MPRCVVIDPRFDWGDERHPRTPLSRSVIYECHVKGMTMLHPAVPEELRGTYLGLSSEPIIEHLLSLGVTAVELLPVHHAITEQRLARAGLVNYWGYSPIGYFAPDARFATAAACGGAVMGRQVVEFKTMVQRFHNAGLEVLVDVVYNHTPEGDHRGPTLAFRGIDNRAYYRLDPVDPSRYIDYTGCGNTLDIRHRRTLQLVMESLRYWVTDLHVDGFRFDLAPVLARDEVEPSPTARIFEAVRQDPVLSAVKLIAEPWDLGPGELVGRFPVGWSEWNGRFRDTVRRFWRGDRGQVADLASRLAGSSDLYETSGRTPEASINFVTCHDGFTLHDLVSYERKHNEANGEDNRDGSDHNLSRNWGAEGPDAPVRTRRIRERIKRNLLATLAFAQGVPMLLHGDELGRSQGGNNNAYCHDGPLTWVHWELDAAGRELLEFTQKVFALRAAHPVFRRRSFFHHQPIAPGEGRDHTWLRPDGNEMTADDWADPSNHLLAMLIYSDADPPDEAVRAGPAAEAILLVLNGGARSQSFTLPRLDERAAWLEMLNTAGAGTGGLLHGQVDLAPHSLVLLRHQALA